MGEECRPPIHCHETLKSSIILGNLFLITPKGVEISLRMVLCEEKPQVYCTVIN